MTDTIAVEELLRQSIFELNDCYQAYLKLLSLDERSTQIAKEFEALTDPSVSSLMAMKSVRMGKESLDESKVALACLKNLAEIIIETIDMMP